MFVRCHAQEVEFLLSTHGPCIPTHESVCKHSSKTVPHTILPPYLYSKSTPPPSLFRQILDGKDGGGGRAEESRAGPLSSSPFLFGIGGTFSQKMERNTHRPKKEPEGIGGGGGGGGGRVALSSDLMHKPCINAGGGGGSLCIAGGGSMTTRKRADD